MTPCSICFPLTRGWGGQDTTFFFVPRMLGTPAVLSLGSPFYYDLTH
jgi:hypothetical protein